MYSQAKLCVAYVVNQDWFINTDWRLASSLELVVQSANSYIKQCLWLLCSFCEHSEHHDNRNFTDRMLFRNTCSLV